MCGIIGYIGKKNCIPVLIDGLKKLEYRGYDSAGISFKDKGLKVIKTEGKINKLEKLITKDNNSNIGIAHTRWSTHGIPSNRNAHPHQDCNKNITIVHNGIIENYSELKQLLKKHKFKSATDTEVISHLIEEELKENGSLLKATQKALSLVEGTFGLLVISKNSDEIIAARKGSPLVMGIGKNEIIIASDITPILPLTKKVIYLQDNEMAIISKNKYKFVNLENEDIKKEVKKLTINLEKIEKHGFPHFMLKEIHEQEDIWLGF